MNRLQGALTAFCFAASFMAPGVATAQVSDPASEVRGSLGVSHENLSLSNDLGKLVFLLNGGFALVSGAFACFAAARHHREPNRDRGHFADLTSGDSVTSI